jgi:hypothetical protein
MKHRLSSLFAAAAVAAVMLAPTVRAAKSASDLLPPDLRRAVVERAQKLAQPVAAAPLPAELASPFSPAGFDKPDPSEAREGRVPPAATAEPKTATPAAPQTDSEVLAAVAAKIPTTGTIILGGKPLLISGMNRIEVGSRFTVVYGGEEYELELVAIDRTTFTVRYKGQEFTRPIKLAKSP